MKNKHSMQIKAGGNLSSVLIVDPKKRITMQKVIKLNWAFMEKVLRIVPIVKNLNESVTTARRNVMWQKIAG